MKRKRWVWVGVAALCLAVVACSREDSIFSASPTFSTAVQAQPPAIVQCVVKYWKRSTRTLNLASLTKDVLISGRPWFRGIAFGVHIRRTNHTTLVDFLEQRAVPLRYLGTLRFFLRPRSAGVDVARPSP